MSFNILYFLVKYCIENDINIAKSIFVAEYNNYYNLEEFDRLNKDMFIDNIQRFIDYCNNRICYFSKDDPYISLDALQSFANIIKAKQIIYDNAGHFNQESGYTKFEDILKEL